MKDILTSEINIPLTRQPFRLVDRGILWGCIAGRNRTALVLDTLVTLAITFTALHRLCQTNHKDRRSLRTAVHRDGAAS